MEKLFAVCLGGRAAGCNTELHDVVFVVGETIEATYAQLLDRWFGAPVGLHLDSWVELNAVDGYSIRLAPEPQRGGDKLFYVNLGAYAEGRFLELHDNVFLVAPGAAEAKARAKTILRARLPGHIHTDDLHEVDDCLAVRAAGGLHVVLEKTGEAGPAAPVNAYHVIPGAEVRAYVAQRK
jgi:hypothetical protein